MGGLLPPKPNTSLNRPNTASAVCTYTRSYRREASPFRVLTAGPPRVDKRLYITKIDKHASGVIARSAQIDSDNAAVGRATPRWVHRCEYYARLGLRQRTFARVRGAFSAPRNEWGTRSGEVAAHHQQNLRPSRHARTKLTPTLSTSGPKFEAAVGAALHRHKSGVNETSRSVT